MAKKWEGTELKPKTSRKAGEEQPSDNREKYSGYKGNPSAHNNPDKKGRNGDNEYVR